MDKTDPICGMKGTIPAHGHYFCSQHCIEKYEKQHNLKLDKCPSCSVKKTKWYKAIADKGSVSLIWPLKPNEHRQWIQKRLQKNSLKADSDSIHLLAELTEGNLLATNQAIIKLRLLHANKMIGIKEMTDVIGDNAQFNVFELSQHLLKGDARNALRVLYQLKAQDTQTTLILWLLAKECRSLLEMSHELKYGKSMRDVLAKQWSNLKSLYEIALRRLTIRQLSRALSACHETYQVIKGLKPGDPWIPLTQTILILVGQS